MKRVLNNRRGWLMIIIVMTGAVLFAQQTDERVDENMTKPGMADEVRRSEQRQMRRGQDSLQDQMQDQMQQDRMHQDKRYAEKAGKQKECDIEGRAGHLQSADAVLGMNVHNSQDQKLGEIQELILDDSRRSIAYVVVEADDKLYLVPWKALGTGQETYLLDIRAEDLGNAPRIDSLDSSQFKDSALREKSEKYYKEHIAARQDKNIGERAMDWVEDTASQFYADEPGQMVYSANQIIGYEVQNQQDEDIGQLQDIIFDVREGNLAYGLVSFGGLMGLGRQVAAVPWDAIQLESTREIAQLQTDRTDLENAVLEDGDMNHLAEPTFARQVHSQFNQEPYWEVFGYVAPTGAADLSLAAWQSDSSYNQNFNPQTVETVQGTVRQVGTFRPDDEAAEGLKLKVRMQDGRTVTVHAGPQQHYLQQQVKFEKGDQVTVTGSRTTVDQKNVIIATELSKGGQTLKLRDAQGEPAWNLQPQQRQDMSERQQQRQQRTRQERQMEETTGDQMEMPDDTPPRYY